MSFLPSEFTAILHSIEHYLPIKQKVFLHLEAIGSRVTFPGIIIPIKVLVDVSVLCAATLPLATPAIFRQTVAFLVVVCVTGARLQLRHIQQRLVVTKPSRLLPQSRFLDYQLILKHAHQQHYSSAPFPSRD